MKLSYFIGWSFSRLIFKFYFGWRVFHAERVPTTGAVILAANHVSYADPPLVGAGVRRPLNYLARDTLFNFPGIGTVLRSWNVVPVDRDGGGGAGLKAILDRLLRGGAILLFPEGRRSRSGQLQSARSGIGLTVIKSQAPVVPVRVFGTFEAFGPHHKLPCRRRIMVKYGKPLRFESLRAEAAGCSKVRLKQIYQEIADEIMAAIAHLEPHTEKTRFP